MKTKTNWKISLAYGEVVQMNRFQKKVAQYGPGIIFGAKNNFQKVTQFGFILFSVQIYYRGGY